MRCKQQEVGELESDDLIQVRLTWTVGTRIDPARIVPVLDSKVFGANVNNKNGLL